MSDLPPLTYSRPRRLAEALAALARPGACAYAGGTDLLVALAERRPWVRFVREVVDIKELAPARGIARVGTALRIGALVTAAELAAHAGVRRHAPALAEAASMTSAPALRGRGTLGGNLVTPHPAGDVATALLALGAVVEIADGRRVRVASVADFIAGRAAEWPRQRLILAVRVPRAPRSGFAKAEARAAFRDTRVAVAVAVVGRGVQVALGGLRARPFLARAAAAAVQHGADVADALVGECVPDTAELAAERLRLAAVLIGRVRTRVGA